MKNNYIKSNSYGKMWIETEDFFKQKKIQETIKDFLKSDLYKKINNKKLGSE